MNETIKICQACGGHELITAFDEKKWQIQGISNELYYVKCSGCGSLFLCPEIPTEELHTYYEKQYDYSTFKSMRTGKEKEATLRAEKVCEFFGEKKTKRVLDIGANAGYFLNAMRNNGWDVDGFELSKEMIEYAKDQFSLSLEQGDFFTLNEKSKTYDAISMWHVLEHLPQPNNIISGVAEQLSKGGLFACAIPNVESLAARVCKDRWRWLSPPVHLHHLTKSGLTQLCNEHGLKLVYWHSVDNFASNDMFFEYLFASVFSGRAPYPTFIQNKLDEIIDAEKDDDQLLFPEVWECEEGTYLESFAFEGIQKKPHKRLRSHTRLASILFAPFMEELWKMGLGAELECYFVKE